MARKKEFDENAVLDKAMALFWEKGYHATSAQDLVDSLGISRSSIYDTYTDKRTLFKKALKQYQDKTTNVLLHVAAKSKDPADTIREIFDQMIRESNEDSALKGCFMVNTAVELAGHDQELGAMVHANNKSVEDALTKLVKKGQEAGQFAAKKSARTYARFLFGSVTALRVAARSGADKKMLYDIVDVSLDALK